MEVQERIRILIKKYYDSQKAFADSIGETTATVNNWVTGKRPIGNIVLDKLIKVFPDISIDWLKTGEGEMLKSDKPLVQLAEESSEIQKLKEEIKYLKQTIEDKNKIIELYEKMNEK